MRERSLMACRRVEDLSVPIDGSSLGRCIECREPIWIAPSTIPIMRDHKPHVACIACVAEIASDEDEVRFEDLTEEQKDEVARWIESI